MNNELFSLIPHDVNQIISNYASNSTLFNMNKMDIISESTLQKVMYQNCVHLVNLCQNTQIQDKLTTNCDYYVVYRFLKYCSSVLWGVIF